MIKFSQVALSTMDVPGPLVDETLDIHLRQLVRHLAIALWDTLKFRDWSLFDLRYCHILCPTREQIQVLALWNEEGRLLAELFAIPDQYGEWCIQWFLDSGLFIATIPPFTPREQRNVNRWSRLFKQTRDTSYLNKITTLR